MASPSEEKPRNDATSAGAFTTEINNNGIMNQDESDVELNEKGESMVAPPDDGVKDSTSSDNDNENIKNDPSFGTTSPIEDSRDNVSSFMSHDEDDKQLNENCEIVDSPYEVKDGNITSPSLDNEDESIINNEKNQSITIEAPVDAPRESVSSVMKQDENDKQLNGNDESVEDTPPGVKDGTYSPLGENETTNNEKNQSITTASPVVSQIPNNSIIGSFHDHFTLPARSSTVRFRASNTASRVYEDSHSQFIIEESGESGKITAKQFPSGNSRLGFLRAVYTLVVLFWTGFLVVFCVQVLLFLIQDLTIQVGATSKQGAEVGEAIGTILSLPMYIHGLASALVLAGHYAMDTWGGFPLFKNFVFGNWSIVTTSWITFFFFLGLPLFIMAICLFIQTDDWWSITALSWFSLIAIFYVVFCMTVVYFEINACLALIRHQTSNSHFWFLLKRAILLRQMSRYSGKTQKIYIARGELEDATGVCSHVDESNARYSIGLYTKVHAMDFVEQAWPVYYFGTTWRTHVYSGRRTRHSPLCHASIVEFGKALLSSQEFQICGRH